MKSMVRKIEGKHFGEKLLNFLYFELQIYFFLILAVIVAATAPFTLAGHVGEVQSLSSNAQSALDTKPFNLQSASVENTVGKKLLSSPFQSMPSPIFHSCIFYISSCLAI